MADSRLVRDNLDLWQRLHDGAGVPCSKPWVSFEERSSSGYVKPCCWYRGRLGQIRTQDDVDAIWSGASYRQLRTSMANGPLPVECPQCCPLLGARPRWFEKQEFYRYSQVELESFDDVFLANRARVMTAALNRDVDLGEAQPLRLQLHPSDVCNLRCVMCYLDLDSGRKREWYGDGRLAALMPYLEEIKIFGGEPFFCETSRALIFDTNKPRWTHTSFLTNGTLVTDRVIESLAEVRIGSIDVSLDAAQSPTYERIRLRGNFHKAVAGARRLVELSRRHRLRAFPVYADFTIQESNYRELDPFIDLCGEVGLIANFTLCGDNSEAPRRAEQQNTELGVRPHDAAALRPELEAAIARASAEKLDFTRSSLENVLREVSL